MRRLLIHITLIVAPLLLLVFLFEPRKEQVYASLEDDCANRGNWIYNRIFTSELPVDIAFLGSSRIENSLNERLMEEPLSGFRTLNLGYCRYGRNLQLRLLEDLVAQKNPAAIVLEVRMTENPSSHPIFPYLAENRDLISAPLQSNLHWFTDWKKAFLFRLQLLQERVWQTTARTSVDSTEYGFIPNYTAPDSLELYESRRIREEELANGSIKAAARDSYSEEYLDRILDFCNENNIRLFLLYLPAYGLHNQPPALKGNYENMGTLLIPPAEILGNQKNWADPNHLNPDGAVLLSRWFAEALSNQMKESVMK